MIKELILGTILLFASCELLADTVFGSWTDPTLADPSYTPENYTPEYQAECRVDGMDVVNYADLVAPTFTVNLTIPEDSLLECRVRNENTLIPEGRAERYSNWTAWTAPGIGIAPLDPTGVFFLQIK